jgi:UDP-glucuronate 4-epimerase
MSQKVLVTGSAGFIGFHLTERLLTDGYEVVGLDIINDYYSVELKYDRLNQLGIDKQLIRLNQITQSSLFTNYQFVKADLADYDFIVDFMKNHQFDYVVNLAAQAGVRYSINNPRAYTHSNIEGFLSILEGSRFSNVKHLIYASTSSVYGLNTNMPLKETQPTEHPMSLYSATKKANEMMAHTYSHLFRLPTTGLRFFTVYGPWGRPDMALFLFADAIKNDKPIKLFNNGNMVRDFTYVGDIVESITRLLTKPAKSNSNWTGKDPDISTSSAPYQIFNIGNSNPVPLMEYVEAIENAMGKVAKKEYLPMQDGDVPATHADTSALETYVSFKPNTSISQGVINFIKWYNQYYNLQ